MSDLRTAPAPGAAGPAGNGSRTDAEAAAEAAIVDAPAVVAVVVASNPGPQFAEMLDSLGNQDYENLSVLVIDAGSDEPIADRVAEVLPQAYLHRLAGDPGWSVAANQSIELVSGSPFLLFCHDDVALAPTCVSTLMGELYRNNAGIAGPKMVRWDDDRKLLQIGMGSDRFGVAVDQVERGEFDQGQYDSVRDVFVAPGGVQLIRADLFVALGGFDPAIGVIGEDLDLCWRAQALGARVLAVSAASARHRESMDDRLPLRERRKLAARHRLRTVMVTASSRRARLTTVPLALFLVALEGLYYLLSGRRGQAKDMYSAIVWNLTRLPDIRRRRRALRQIRQRSVREVRARQVGGSATVSSFSRGQVSAGQDRFSGFLGAIRSSFAGEDSGSLRDATVIGFAIALILAFGSRHLLTRGVVAVGQIPVVPSARALLEEWFGGWRSAGTGGPGNPPTALLFLAAARALLFWAPGLFDNLLVVAPIVVGVFGAYRLARPLGSARSGAVAAAFYAATPLLTSAFAAGRWDSLVIYATAPFLVASLLRLDGVSPYGSRLGPPGLKVVPRSFPVLVIRYGILVAVAAAFVPAVMVIAVVLALAFVLAAALTEQGLPPRDFVLPAVAAVVAPVALHLPWAYDVIQSLSWHWLVGPPSPEASVPTFTRLLAFAPGRFGPSVFAVGLVLASVLGLALAARPMWRVAAQGWSIALLLFVLVWARGRGWVPFALPATESMLAPALAGLTLVVAVGVRSLELERNRITRWRLANRFLPTVMGLCLLAASLNWVILSFHGAWNAPSQSYATFTRFLSERTERNGRVLWIGDASVLPLDAMVSPSGVEYAVTDGGSPDVWGRWLAGPLGSTDGIGEALDLARAGQTVRLGRLLAPYGIDLVVALDRLAPAPYEGPVVDPGQNVLRSLAQQLDLKREPGVPNLVVFRNDSSAGLVAVLPTPEAADAVTPADQLDVDLSPKEITVAVTTDGPGQWTLTPSGPIQNPLLMAVPDADFVVNGGGGDADLLSGFDGLTVIPTSVPTPIEIDYPVPLRRRAGELIQLLVVGLGAILAQTRRESQL